MKNRTGVHMQAVAVLAAIVPAIALLAPDRVSAQATCSLVYQLPADVVPDTVQDLTDLDFMAFAWQNFLALNAPAVGGQISVNSDNTTQWSGWSSTADLLNQTQPGPPGSRYYPAVCQSVPNYQQYRVLQQVGKVDDSFLEAQTSGLSEDPVIDPAGNFLRYEILLSPVMYNAVVAQGLNDPDVLSSLTTNVNLPCGEVSYTGGDPADSRMGVIVLKIAWRDTAGMTPDLVAAHHTEKLLVYSPSYRNSTGVDTCDLKTMAMVGMHIAHKTTKQPNWIWATFENVVNAPECQGMPSAPHNPEINTNCPSVNPANDFYNLNPAGCDQAGNQSCAPCNMPPAKNGIGQCVNPFMEPDAQNGWCLDLPPNPVGGISQLCRQIPAGTDYGYCSTNLTITCQMGAASCPNGGECLEAYPGASEQTSACWNAITSAPGFASGATPWYNYQLISSQWLAAVATECQNNATDVAAGPTGPVLTSGLREQVTLAIDANGNPTMTRPWLGNTSMESYDRSNCLGCHAKSYLNGTCSNDNTRVCSSSADCSGGAACTQYNTDFMYFLKLEVAQPPALRYADARIEQRERPAGHSTNDVERTVHLFIQGEQVLTGQKGSMNDPRCNASVPGTVKAELRFSRTGRLLEGGRIPLPCEGWSLQEKGPNSLHRFRYSDPKGSLGPCESVVIDPGRALTARCTGAKLPRLLPPPDAGTSSLQVMLVTGRLRQCAEFDKFETLGGTHGSSVVGQSSKRPDQCPDL